MGRCVSQDCCGIVRTILIISQTGELWLKGPNIFLGYHNQPERTKESFSEDGWMKTGDILKMDKYGNYYPVDRLKELIKYSEAYPFPYGVWELLF